MKKKLFILYTDRMRQPYYGYFHPVSKHVYDFICYMTINNFKKFPFPSLYWSIQKYLRYKNYFGYWTSYRKWEETISFEEYKSMRFKTYQWIKSLFK